MKTSIKIAKLVLFRGSLFEILILCRFSARVGGVGPVSFGEKKRFLGRRLTYKIRVEEMCMAGCVCLWKMCRV